MTRATNTYSVQFTCKDPETGLPVVYTLTVTTKPEEVVRAIDLLQVVDRLASKPAYIEELADKFKTRFPGQHILKGVNLGVEAVARRQGTA